MGFSKTIQVGSAGSVVITEEAGVASVKVSLVESVGGGSVAGVAKASVSAEVDVDGHVLVDAGLSFLKSKYPSLAGAVDSLKGFIDAEIAKV